MCDLVFFTFFFFFLFFFKKKIGKLLWRATKKKNIYIYIFNSTPISMCFLSHLDPRIKTLEFRFLFKHSSSKRSMVSSASTTGTNIYLDGIIIIFFFFFFLEKSNLKTELWCFLGTDHHKHFLVASNFQNGWPSTPHGDAFLSMGQSEKLGIQSSKNSRRRERTIIFLL
jgi:hypothetical protein